MKVSVSIRETVAVAVAALWLAACGESPDTLIASAKDYAAKGDYKAAVIQLKSALQKEPRLPEARFLLGKALLESGDPVGAEVELHKAIDEKYVPDSAVPLWGMSLLASGQAKRVLSELNGANLTSAEARADVLTTQAAAWFAADRPDKARECLAEAIKLKPDASRALLGTARLAGYDNDYEEAQRLADRVLQIEPKNFEAHKLRGDILLRKGQVEPALEAYRKAVEIRPDYVQGYGSLITGLLATQRVADAGAQLEVMKKNLPKHPATRMLETRYLFEKGEFAKAWEFAQQMLGDAPEDTGTLLLAGAIQVKLNNMARAEDFLTKVLKKTPDSLYARRLLVFAYLRMGQPARALMALEPVLGQIERDPAFLSLAGETFMVNGNPQKAESYFAKAAALDPNDPKKQTALALTHMAGGRADSAFGELERIAAADTGVSADMAMISSAIKRKDFAKALQGIDSLQKKRPDDPMGPTLRGTVLAAKGDFPGARASLERALKLNPGYLPAALALASIDLREKNPEAAKQRLNGILAAEPKNAAALLALAEIESRTGADQTKVIDMITKAVQAAPSDISVRLALIKAYWAAKDEKRALAAAQEAVVAVPGNPELLDTLGQLQLASGDINQSLATYGKLAGTMPSSPVPDLRMAEVHLRAKDPAAAEQSLRKALVAKPDFLPAQRLLVALFLQTQRIDQARQIISEIRGQRPKEAAADLLQGDIAVSQKAWHEAAVAYRAGLKMAPSGELAAKLYQVLYAGGKSAEAEAVASKWLAEHPKDLEFRLGVADTALRRKDYPLAVRHYQAVLEYQADQIVALNNLAWIFLQTKDAKALALAERANRLAPNQPDTMDTLAMVLLGKGDVAQALPLLQKAAELAPQSPDLRLHLAQAYLKAGRAGEAKKLLDELAKLGDKYPGQAEVARLRNDAGG